MDLRTETANGVSILTLDGRFDAYEVPRVNEWFEQTTSVNPAKVVVNMTDVKFVDSSALALLVKGMKRCRQQGGDLVLCNLQQPVRIIFELTRLDKAFNITSSQDEALRSFQ
jgi:anti-sigma B factor antagonist